MPDFLEHAPYLGIMLILVLTGSGLPIPEEAVVISAGVASSLGELEPWRALLSCLVGALLGDCLMYYIGFHFGRSVLREHPWWARFVKPEREQKMEEMIRAHGLKVFFLARFLVGLRSPVYLTAGILRVPFRRFLLVDAFSATVVIGLFFGLSYQYGEHIHKWLRRGQYSLTIIVVGAILAAVGYFFWRRRKRKLAAAAAAFAIPPIQLTPAEPAIEHKEPAA